MSRGESRCTKTAGERKQIRYRDCNYSGNRVFLLCKRTEHTKRWLMRQWRRKPGKKCGNGMSCRYTLVCLTHLSASNLSGDTWAITKRPTIWHYQSPIFLNHFSAHIDIDNDFAQQIPNPWVILVSKCNADKPLLPQKRKWWRKHF